MYAPEKCTALYNEGIRSVLTDPDLTFSVLTGFSSDDGLLPEDAQKELIGLMYTTIRRWHGRGDRVRALHGDFWGGNIFIRPDDSVYVIDFSRAPWGDPALDVGWFISPILWLYHETGNVYYRELIDMWFRFYVEKTGDKEIYEAVVLVMGWVGVINVYPRFFSDRNTPQGKQFMKHIFGYSE